MDRNDLAAMVGACLAAYVAVGLAPFYLPNHIGIPTEKVAGAKPLLLFLVNFDSNLFGAAWRVTTHRETVCRTRIIGCSVPSL